MKKVLFLLLPIIWLSSCSYFHSFSYPDRDESTNQVNSQYISNQPKTPFSAPGTAATITLPDEINIKEDIVYPDEEELTTDEGIDVEIPEVRVYLPLPFPYPLQKIKFDFPVTYNTEVAEWINYFTGKGRKHFKKWLSRMYLYITYIKEKFRENDLPQDLAYLPLIESGFNVRARSPAWAVGMWQFMATTGRKYGLKINYWIDERRDPWKSTDAAIRYLSDLYNMFHNWYLAIAAYNAGEGKIKRAIKIYRTNDFWTLKKYRYIRRETANYVPKFIAALLIAKCPSCFNFHIKDSGPLMVEKVQLPFPVDLYLVSQLTGVQLDKILFYNPELRHWVTPPDYPGYKLKLPPGKGQILLASLKKMDKKLIAKRYLKYRKKVRERTFVRYRIRWGETLSHIARRYRVSVRTLMRINHIRNPRRVRAGRRILVPIVRGRTLTYYTGGRYYVRPFRRHYYRHRYHSRWGIKYKVRQGDSLWSIARKFGISISELKRWNDIRGNYIKVGQILYLRKIRLKYARSGSIKYTVKEGDTLWDISKKFGVSLSNIRTLKKRYPGRALHPGDVLLIEKD